jgi:hypothetical protein
MAEILGDSHADWLADLGQLVTEIGYRMCIADTGNAEGIHHGPQKLIEISDAWSPTAGWLLGSTRSGTPSLRSTRSRRSSPTRRKN